MCIVSQIMDKSQGLPDHPKRKLKDKASRNRSSITTSTCNKYKKMSYGIDFSIFYLFLFELLDL